MKKTKLPYFLDLRSYGWDIVIFVILANCLILLILLNIQSKFGNVNPYRRDLKIFVAHTTTYSNGKMSRNLELLTFVFFWTPLMRNNIYHKFSAYFYHLHSHICICTNLWIGFGITALARLERYAIIYMSPEILKYTGDTFLGTV